MGPSARTQFSFGFQKKCLNLCCRIPFNHNICIYTDRNVGEMCLRVCNMPPSSLSPSLSLSPFSLSLPSIPLLSLPPFSLPLSPCVCCSVQEEMEVSSSVTSRLEEMRKTGGDKWLSLLNSGASNSGSPIVDGVSHKMYSSVSTSDIV